MKLILTSLLFLSATFAFAQKKGATMRDLEGLPGNWTGTLTYTDYSDDKKQVSLLAKLEIVTINDSLRFKYSYTEPNGKVVKDNGDMRIYNEGKQLLYDGHEFDVMAVRRVGPRLTIIGERDGTDNDKEAIIRETFVIGSGVFNITKEVKYETAAKFFVRNQLQLRKN